MAKIEIPQDDRRLQLRLTLATEWIYLVCCGLFGPAALTAIIWDIVSPEADAPGGGWSYPILFGLGIGGLGLWSCAFAIGALWRLRDRRPALTADADRLVFHPSVLPRPLDWSDIARIDITTGRGANLAIRLRQRIWSLYVPQTSQTIALPLISCGLSYREGQAILRRLRGWQRAAGRGTGE